MENQNELVVIEQANALEIFTRKDGLDPFLVKIREEIDGFTADISTDKGRKEIASMAYRVAQSKTYLDGVGKELVAELKEKPKLIDNERKRIRDILDKWKDEVRRPLTEWENAEKFRVETHQKNLDKIKNIHTSCEEGICSDAINSLIAKLSCVSVDNSWEEFEEGGKILYGDTMLYLKERLGKRLRYEDEQRELVKLRQERDERARKERDEQIAKEAAELARQEAEEKSKREMAEAKRREEDLRLKAERAEIEKKESELRREREKLEAEKRAKENEQRAIEAERTRVAAENKKKEDEEKKRQANIAHRRGINKATLTLLEKSGFDSTIGTKIITLAAQGKLGNLVMTY